MSKIKCVPDGSTATKTVVENTYGETFEIFTDYSKFAEDYPGESKAPSPQYTFLAMISACQLVHLVNCCKDNGMDYTELSLDLEVVESSNDKEIEKINTIISFPEEFTAEQKSEAIELAKACPVVKNLCFNTPPIEYL